MGRSTSEALPKPFDARSVEALRRQSFKSADGIIKRLIATYDVQQKRIEDLEHELELAREPKRETNTEAGERAFEHREKVLVVVDWDGYVEVYAEAWCSVKVVALLPGEEKDAVIDGTPNPQNPQQSIGGLPEKWKELFYPVNLRAEIMPHFVIPPNEITSFRQAVRGLVNIIRAHDNRALLPYIQGLTTIPKEAPES